MERIVVGVDGSDHSRRALAWAIGEARARQAALVAVHAWHLPAAAASYAGPLVDPKLLEEEAAKALADALASADAHGVEVEQRVVRGGPAAALLDAAADADLLVVGSRGHGGFAGLLLGSVSQQVCHHAACPVVVVP